MRPLIDMDTIQIEITNACIHACSNCTRFCGHQKPFFMPLAEVKRAIDSMVGYPKMTGIMGGEPLLHPDFEAIVTYAAEKIPKTQLGLWSCFPKGYEKYGNLICDTIGQVFLNDHTRNDIFHAPILIAAEEVYTDRIQMYAHTEHCWIQEYWSASINPKGAYFCEIAAALAMLLGGSNGWKVEPGWWWRVTKDFRGQREEFCAKCGCALAFPRRRSIEEIDDISPGMVELLKGRSIRVDKGQYKVSDLKQVDCPEQMAAYKDMGYRNRIAERYGITLVINQIGFCTPVKRDDAKKSIYQQYKDRFGGGRHAGTSVGSDSQEGVLGEPESPCGPSDMHLGSGGPS